MPRQYVAVEFKPGGRRYTYHNDGEPVAIGDLVKVETRYGQQTVTVADLVIPRNRHSRRRPIIGRHEPEGE
jgi:hypothetical protein